jgi:uncharacterized protein YrrD
MKIKFLTAVSAIAIMASIPAFADAKVGVNAQTNNTISTQSVEEERTAGQSDIQHVTGADIERGVNNAADSVATAVGNTTESFNALFIDDTADAKPESMEFRTRTTASGMIGQPVFNSRNERIATVEDIILDQSGNAQLVVLANGGFLGVGEKLAAFDYNMVSKRDANGDVIMPLSEETIKKVTAFSYESEDRADNLRVMPTGGISVKEVLDGQIVADDKKTLADVDNLTFAGGRADRLIVSFDKTLGMGGQQAALSYKALRIVREPNSTDIDFQMSANQTANFETYKNSATN